MSILVLCVPYGSIVLFAGWFSRFAVSASCSVGRVLLSGSLIIVFVVPVGRCVLPRCGAITPAGVWNFVYAIGKFAKWQVVPKLQEAIWTKLFYKNRVGWWPLALPCSLSRLLHPVYISLAGYSYPDASWCSLQTVCFRVPVPICLQNQVGGSYKWLYYPVQNSRRRIPTRRTSLSHGVLFPELRQCLWGDIYCRAGYFHFRFSTAWSVCWQVEQ